MKELMTSPYFGVGLSVVAFWIGEKLHSKLKTPICNPLIVAIVVSISEPAGGVVPITVVAVIFTGILGSILAPTLIKIFHVKDSVAAGLAIGACSHAVGTSKAIEIGEIEGAMSGLAIGICGIITVLFSMLIM